MRRCDLDHADARTLWRPASVSWLAIDPIVSLRARRGKNTLGVVMAAHRRSFTRDELDELRRLVREKQTADRDRQKRLRDRMRKIGFYISDFTDEPEGFVASDLDALIQRGTITISKEGD